MPRWELSPKKVHEKRASPIARAVRQWQEANPKRDAGSPTLNALCSARVYAVSLQDHASNPTVLGSISESVSISIATSASTFFSVSISVSVSTGSAVQGAPSGERRLPCL